MYSKKKVFPLKKLCFLSKYTFEHVNYSFEDPAKSSSPTVLDCFASCPKKVGIYSFEKKLITPQNVPLDIWKVVLRTLLNSFRQKVQNILSKIQKQSWKSNCLTQDLFLRTFSLTSRNQFNPVELFSKNAESFLTEQFLRNCRNFSVKKRKEKIMFFWKTSPELYFWRRKKQFRQIRLMSFVTGPRDFNLMSGNKNTTSFCKNKWFHADGSAGNFELISDKSAIFFSPKVLIFHSKSRNNTENKFFSWNTFSTEGFSGYLVCNFDN